METLNSEVQLESPVRGTAWARGWRHVKQTVLSLYIWIMTALLVVFWIPFVYLVWRRDSDEFKYRTSAAIRRLNLSVCRINPLIELDIQEGFKADPNRAYIVIANHQSMADIPLLSNLPMPLKWVSKESLFKIPLTGWLMRMARDIPVRIHDPDKTEILDRAKAYGEHGLSVVFFPEGKRSKDGYLYRFSRGAFELAVESGIPILPVALDGLHRLLPMHSWRFTGEGKVKLKVLHPVETSGYSHKDSGYLREKVRFMIMDQLAEWRAVDRDSVDGIMKDAHVRAAGELEHDPLFF
ncbi:MAG: 1-acyl-sn-glycerol-3-phosphate acyltransferase [Kiritimatiellia bacterium]|jgi:1-acyl-sn-glycerol-3-phosphate acyltransferase